MLWSPHSVSSRWVRAEATLADRNKTLVPVTIAPCERPIMFELTQTAELSHWRGDRSDQAWTAFLNEVRQIAGKGARPEAGPAAAAPHGAAGRKGEEAARPPWPCCLSPTAPDSVEDDACCRRFGGGRDRCAHQGRQSSRSAQAPPLPVSGPLPCPIPKRSPSNWAFVISSKAMSAVRRYDAGHRAIDRGRDGRDAVVAEIRASAERSGKFAGRPGCGGRPHARSRSCTRWKSSARSGPLRTI